MLVCFFRLLTENGFGFTLLRSFLKYFFCEPPRVRLTFLKVDVLNLFTSPGAFEILCQVFQNELCRIFLLPDTGFVEI
jgi:hypothetical protein